MDTASRARAIGADIARSLSGSGVVVDDVTIRPAGRRRLLRVSLARDVAHLLQDDIDTPVEPLSLDEVAASARTIDEVLESGDSIGQGPYTLEVSSAGVGQPLDTPDRFRRNVGRLVEVTGVDGRTSRQRLFGASAQGVQLSDDPLTTLAYADVARAVVQIEFTRPDAREDS